MKTGAPDPLNSFPATKDSTLLHHRNFSTLEWNQRPTCLCFHKYTKMSIYPHRPESMFYTVYLPTTIKSFLGTAKRHDSMCGNFFYDELLTISSLPRGDVLMDSHCLQQKGTTRLILQKFL